MLYRLVADCVCGCGKRAALKAETPFVADAKYHHSGRWLGAKGDAQDWKPQYGFLCGRCAPEVAKELEEAKVAKYEISYSIFCVGGCGTRMAAIDLPEGGEKFKGSKYYGLECDFCEKARLDPPKVALPTQAKRRGFFARVFGR